VSGIHRRPRFRAVGANLSYVTIQPGETSSGGSGKLYGIGKPRAPEAGSGSLDTTLFFNLFLLKKLFYRRAVVAKFMTSVAPN
jgi:hypothetical protein